MWPSSELSSWLRKQPAALAAALCWSQTFQGWSGAHHSTGWVGAQLTGQQLLPACWQETFCHALSTHNTFNRQQPAEFMACQRRSIFMVAGCVLLTSTCCD